MTFRESKLVLCATDLAGWARATAARDALSLAAFLDDWYRRCGAVLRPRGGRIVKFMGDGCFAVFPEEACLLAVDAALELARDSAAVGAPHQLQLDVGVNLHLAIVAEGELGPDDDRRYDVFGSAVNHLFRMGGGPGVRISEPLYRRLPNERRAPWQRTRPPATYTLARG
jgi:adenylate cyclase